MSTTGLDLRLERVAARVKLNTLAAAMKRDRRTVGRYEGLAVVPDEVADEFRTTLATLRDVATESVA